MIEKIDGSIVVDSASSCPSDLNDRNLWRHSVFYMFFASVQKLISVGLAPVLTIILLPETFAVLDTLVLLNTLLLTVVVFGMDSATARFIYDTETGELNIGAFFVGLFVVCMMSLLLLIVVWGFAGELSRIDGYLSATSYRAWICFLISLPLTGLFNLLINYFKWVGKQRVMFFTTVVFSLLHIVLGVLVWKVAGVPFVDAYFLGQGIAACVCVSFASRHINWQHGFRKSRGMLLPMLGFGMPFVLVGLGQQGLFFLERMVADQLVSADEIGSYAANFRYSLLFKLPLLGVLTACGPICFAELLGRGDQGIFIRMKKRLSLMFVLYAVGVVSMIAVVAIVGGGRFGIVDPLQIAGLLCVHVLDALVGVIAAVYDIEKKTGWKAMAYLGCGVLALALDWTLVPMVGLNGLIFGNIVSRVVLLLVCVKFYNLVFPGHVVDRQSLLVVTVWALIVVGLIFVLG